MGTSCQAGLAVLLTAPWYSMCPGVRVSKSSRRVARVLYCSRGLEGNRCEICSVATLAGYTKRHRSG